MTLKIETSKDHSYHNSLIHVDTNIRKFQVEIAQLLSKRKGIERPRGLYGTTFGENECIQQCNRYIHL